MSHTLNCILCFRMLKNSVNVCLLNYCIFLGSISLLLRCTNQPSIFTTLVIQMFARTCTKYSWSVLCYILINDLITLPHCLRNFPYIYLFAVRIWLIYVLMHLYLINETRSKCCSVFKYSKILYFIVWYTFLS